MAGSGQSRLTESLWLAAVFAVILMLPLASIAGAGAPPQEGGYPDPGGSECDPYDELRCTGGYNWEECLCEGEVRTATPEGPPEFVAVPTEPVWVDTTNRNLHVGDWSLGGRSYWHGYTFMVDNSRSGSYIELPLSTGARTELQGSARVQVLGGTVARPVAGIVLDPGGANTSGNGAIFFGKTHEHLVLDRLVDGTWRPMLQQYYVARGQDADLFQVVRSGNALYFHVNGYQVGAFSEATTYPVSVELYVGPGSVAGYSEWWVYGRN